MASRVLEAGLLASCLRVNIWDKILNIFVQVTDKLISTGRVNKALHVLGDTIGAGGHALAGVKELAEERKRSSIIIEIRDELTLGIVQTKLAAFHERVDVGLGINEVITTDLTLHSFGRTGHRGVADSDNLRVPSRDEEEEGENCWAEAPHNHKRMLTPQLTRLQDTEGVVQKITRISQMRKLYYTIVGFLEHPCVCTNSLPKR